MQCVASLLCSSNNLKVHWLRKQKRNLIIYTLEFIRKQGHFSFEGMTIFTVYFRVFSRLITRLYWLKHRHVVELT